MISVCQVLNNRFKQVCMMQSIILCPLKCQLSLSMSELYKGQLMYLCNCLSILILSCLAYKRPSANHLIVLLLFVKTIKST